jgi:ketosteroid isomerase-like protein
MESLKFDDTRIRHHHDKRLLRYIRAYFNAFTAGDFDGMKALQSEDYTMTDIRKTIRPFPLPLS